MFLPGMHLALAMGGAVLFSAYIVYDVHMIANRLSPDEYIHASISLYLDIVNLFLHLLRILAEMQKSCGANPNVCTSSPAGPTYVVKLLVRSDACGSIIGKGGAIIAQMRQMSGAMIKIETAEGNSHDQAQAAASGSDDGTAKIWEVLTGTLLLTLQHGADQAGVKSLAFSPDGRLLARAEGNTVVLCCEIGRASCRERV